MPNFRGKRNRFGKIGFLSISHKLTGESKEYDNYFVDEFINDYLENIIYNELLIQGFAVFAGKTYKGEIDFVAIKGNKKCFIQIAYLLSGEETIKREFAAYDKISDASPKYVRSLDRIDLSHDGTGI